MTTVAATLFPLEPPAVDRGLELRAVLADVSEAEMASLGWVRSTSHTGRMRLALRDLLGLVVDRTMSGEWRGDPEIEPEVQRARSLLLDQGVEEQVGWIRYDDDRDAYEDFRYLSTTDRSRAGRIIHAGYWPVFARRL